MDIQEQKKKLQLLIDELIKLGEDEKELELWHDLFDILDEKEQEGILKNLGSEIEELKKLESYINKK
jgi:hypothetical protein